MKTIEDKIKSWENRQTNRKKKEQEEEIRQQQKAEKLRQEYLKRTGRKETKPQGLTFMETWHIISIIIVVVAAIGFLVYIGVDITDLFDLFDQEKNHVRILQYFKS